MVHAPTQDTKEELYEQIRDLHAMKTEGSEEGRYDLECLELGELIATGCNAAVYRARLTATDHTPGPGETESDISVISEEDGESDCSELVDDESDISVIEEDESMEELDWVESCTSDVEVEGEASPTANEEESLSFTIIDEEALSTSISDGERSFYIIDEDSLSDVSVIEEDSQSDDSAICSPASESRGDYSLTDLNFNLLPKDPGGTGIETVLPGVRETTVDDFDLAVKMMFNYDTESNAEAILRAMEKEVVPLIGAPNPLQTHQWRNGNHVKKKAWPAHPNIVRMYGLFIGAVPDVPDSVEHYPAALPPRIFSEGLGRNMTLFLVMKRYSCTLSDYLSKESPSMSTRCSLLCQLLEGVAFLQQRSVAHRDLKSDNLLIDLSQGPEWPRLVISDFGCCLNEGTLQIPYVTSEINKGGNSALMAPEIACAVAGRHSVLDYRKSDQWAVGALVYEIMGCPNPFYRSKARPARLDTRTYREEDLPDLPDEVPVVVEKLARNLLKRDTSQRISGSVAATVMQLHMRSLSEHNNANNNNNNVQMKDIQNWAVNNAASTILTRSCGHTDSHVTSDIKQAFLSRISHHDLQIALQFMQTV